MKSLSIWQLELIPWYVFSGYWLMSWLRVKRTKAREKSADRLITVAVVVTAYELLFAQWLRIGPLRLRVIPDEAWIAWVGIGVTWIGVAVAIWARYCIGAYWSARVTLKEGHQLIRSGPYAFVRHPIYTGMLVGCIGAALVVGEWRGIVAVLLLLAAHSRKAMREENLLTTEFGERYTEYRRGTGFLFPRLWPRHGMDTHPQGS
ncbi:MAG TPA: isoprenylcysteine carboxylmethyltransferase family protein [Candidatus Sulfotelmatobacter sp.]|nr:isoprenylcysteine carboxylmethyltransferase family protein [Candidatus Sulfotelmatobacter sp.]